MQPLHHHRWERGPEGTVAAASHGTCPSGTWHAPLGDVARAPRGRGSSYRPAGSKRTGQLTWPLASADVHHLKSGRSPPLLCLVRVRSPRVHCDDLQGLQAHESLSHRTAAPQEHRPHFKGTPNTRDSKSCREF